MANTTETETTGWVDEMIARLEPTDDLQPDAGRALARIREREQRRAARRRSWLWATTLAGVLGVGLLSFPPTRAIAERCYSAACAMVLPQFATNGVLTVPGDGLAVAPDFVRHDAQGQQIRLSDLRGNVVLLNFWATWCGPCQEEMPWLVELQRRYKPRGLAVVAVSLDELGWVVVSPFMDKVGANFPVVLGDEDLVKQFGNFPTLPTTFLIDQEGVIRRQYTGLVDASEYEAAIQALLD